MKKDNEVYLRHMLEISQQIKTEFENRGRAAIESDQLAMEGLVRLIQKIGEAARHVSVDFRIKHSDVPWTEIIGMRDRVVHDYMRVQVPIVWKTVEKDIPKLIQILEKLIQD